MTFRLPSQTADDDLAPKPLQFGVRELLGLVAVAAVLLSTHVITGGHLWRMIGSKSWPAYLSWAAFAASYYYLLFRRPVDTCSALCWAIVAWQLVLLGIVSHLLQTWDTGFSCYMGPQTPTPVAFIPFYRVAMSGLVLPWLLSIPLLRLFFARPLQNAPRAVGWLVVATMFVLFDVTVLPLFFEVILGYHILPDGTEGLWLPFTRR